MNLFDRSQERVLNILGEENLGLLTYSVEEGIFTAKKMVDDYFLNVYKKSFPHLVQNMVVVKVGENFNDIKGFKVFNNTGAFDCLQYKGLNEILLLRFNKIDPNTYSKAMNGTNIENEFNEQNSIPFASKGNQPFINLYLGYVPDTKYQSINYFLTCPPSIANDSWEINLNSYLTNYKKRITILEMNDTDTIRKSKISAKIIPLNTDAKKNINNISKKQRK